MIEILTTFWSGLAIGLVVGTTFGVFISGLCAMAKKGDS
jgi:uncharacterized membrane-anchored protein YhcB (DUF1043 family)